jgi:hypothetical protein
MIYSSSAPSLLTSPSLPYTLATVRHVARTVFTGTTKTCGIQPANPSSSVQIRLNTVTQGVTVQGVWRCQNRWLCPSCGWTKSKRERSDLTQAIDVWTQQGHSLMMGTFTVGHTAGRALKSLIDSYNSAVSAMLARGPHRAFKVAIGASYTAKCFEVTWSEERGWHPHSHVLYFCTGSHPDPVHFQSRLAGIWTHVAGRHGLTASKLYGATLTHSDEHAAEYLTKAAEIGASRKAHGALTPLGMLGTFGTTGDLALRTRLREYQTAIKGRHALQWGRGLKAASGLLDAQASYTAIPAETSTYQTIYTFDAEVWRVICKAGKHEDVVKIARTHGAEGVNSYVAKLISG